MSNKLPESQPSEEVDLRQLFKLIGRAFDRFFGFIGSILNKLFLAFVWMVFFVKKHFIKIALAGVLGFALGYAKQKLGTPIYKSEIVIKQNYSTGENLYSSIDYLNQLITELDSTGLSSNLGISNIKANAIIGLDVEPIINNNIRMSLFDKYTKSLDSITASNIDFKTFVESSNDYEISKQKIILWTDSKDSSTGIIPEIIKNIERLEYFKNEQKKDLAELDRRENAIKASLKQSDSLQSVYKEVLIKSVETTVGSQTSVTIDNTEDKSVTKEFELYKSDLELRRELVDIQREKEDKEHIIEVLSSNQNKGTLDDARTIFGIDLNYKIVFSLFLSLLVFVILLSIEFIRYLERFKSKL